MTKKRTAPTNTIPTIDCEVRFISDYNHFSQQPEIRKAVFDHTITAVKRGLRSEKTKEVALFRINSTGMILTLDRPKWKSTLKNALRFYKSAQYFEKCIDCQELIDRL